MRDLQNDYDELHALLDWAVPGGLGERHQFQEYYEHPIKMAQKKDIDESALGRVSQLHRQALLSCLAQMRLTVIHSTISFFRDFLGVDG